MTDAEKYWKENVKLVIGCLIVWFLVSFFAGIFIAPALNGIKIAGYKLGFWFAQQGSIYVFIALIFYYANKMNGLDRKYRVEE